MPRPHTSSFLSTIGNICCASDIFHFLDFCCGKPVWKFYEGNVYGAFYFSYVWQQVIIQICQAYPCLSQKTKRPLQLLVLYQLPQKNLWETCHSLTKSKVRHLTYFSKACQLWKFEYHVLQNLSELTLVEYIDPAWVKYMWWIYFIGLIWTSEFIMACQQMVIAGAVAHWFYRHKFTDNSHVTYGLSKLMKYHLGSVAFGSFIITLFKIPRLILTYLHEKWVLISYDPD